MAANGAQHVFAPVLAAHNTMSSGADRAQKEQAHQFLEHFQKSVRAPWLIRCIHGAHADTSPQDEAWTATLAMLEANNVDAAAKLFAATTLKGKVGCSSCMPRFADSRRLSTTCTNCPARRSLNCEKPS